MRTFLNVKRDFVVLYEFDWFALTLYQNQGGIVARKGPRFERIGALGHCGRAEVYLSVRIVIFSSRAAWAAARRATGIRLGEQET